MAVWQFKFSLVPEQGIEDIHGKMMPTLSVYQSGKFQVLNDEDDPNYWKGHEIGPEVINQIEKILPRRKAWSDEAAMYGTEEGDGIEIWPDDFNCTLDLRNLSLDNLNVMIELAKSMRCRLVLHGSGEVMEPDLMDIVQKIKNSNAYAFCMSPRDYLLSLSKTE